VAADQRVGPVAQPPRASNPTPTTRMARNTRPSLPSTKLRPTASSTAMSTASA